MTNRNLEKMSVDTLVADFSAIGEAQYIALLDENVSKFNRLFDQKIKIVDELKARLGDQRRALLRLYDHPNAQVRLNAIKSTLAVAPKRARRMLEILAESQDFPQSGDAGMTIDGLDDGSFKPT